MQSLKINNNKKLAIFKLPSVADCAGAGLYCGSNATTVMNNEWTVSTSVITDYFELKTRITTTITSLMDHKLIEETVRTVNSPYYNIQE